MIRMMDETDESDTQMLQVDDLPQLYTKPEVSQLLAVLDLLRLQPTSFQNVSQSFHKGGKTQQVNPNGVPRYLTSIVSSSLSWIKDDDAKEQIWDMASARLSERSGRNAMPSMTRPFVINKDLTINLHEPSMTEDNLGFKTWTSSLLLAKRLHHLKRHVPVSCTRILELGSGTGLVGIAAAYTWNIDVVLTDLPAIVPNLQKNVESNQRPQAGKSSKLIAYALDWSDETNAPGHESDKFDIILAADPIYSPDHPQMLVDTVRRWLSFNTEARFIVELPLRTAYQEERADLKTRLQEIGLDVVEQGTEVGYDDWQGQDGQPVEVECWWSVWGRASC